MKERSGIGKLSLRRLTKILGETEGTISITDLATSLQTSSKIAGDILSRWYRAGWVLRVRRGLYVPVPVEARTRDEALSDPWLIAARLYAPCYITGWSAAAHWKLTSEPSTTTVVGTAKPYSSKTPQLGSHQYLLRRINEQAQFGTKAVRRGLVQVHIADPTRTVVDGMLDPALMGGVDRLAIVFRSYMGSNHANLSRLIEYGDSMPSNIVFRRLGFLTQQLFPQQFQLIEACAQRIRTGYSFFDPTQKEGRYIGKWGLRIPKKYLEAGCHA